MSAPTWPGFVYSNLPPFSPCRLASSRLLSLAPMFVAAFLSIKTSTLSWSQFAAASRKRASEQFRLERDVCRWKKEETRFIILSVRVLALSLAQRARVHCLARSLHLGGPLATVGRPAAELQAKTNASKNAQARSNSSRLKTEASN